MVSELAGEKAASILTPEATEAALAEYAKLALAFLTMRFAVDDGSRDRMAAALSEMHQRLFRDCTEVGPPSKLGPGQNEAGDLVMICGHDPQHRYDYRTGELIE